MIVQCSQLADLGLNLAGKVRLVGLGALLAEPVFVVDAAAGADLARAGVTQATDDQEVCLSLKPGREGISHDKRVLEELDLLFGEGRRLAEVVAVLRQAAGVALERNDDLFGFSGLVIFQRFRLFNFFHLSELSFVIVYIVRLRTSKQYSPFLTKKLGRFRLKTNVCILKTS